MWGTIANLKENLNKIAQDVHDDEDDSNFEIYAAINGGETTPLSDRRNSHGSARSRLFSNSPLANGIDSTNSPEVQQYKSEIKRLQDSEAEIKALSVNYAALLKEKEEQISKLNKENGLLKHDMEVTRKGSGNSSPNRSHELNAQAKTRYFGNQVQNGSVSKHDGMSNGIARPIQSDALQSKIESKYSVFPGKEKECADSIDENNRSSPAAQATPELRNLRMEVERERNNFASVQQKLVGEQKLNEALREELMLLKTEKDRTSAEMKKLHDDSSQKISAAERLHRELSKRKDEGEKVIENLKQSIGALEKENASLKKEKNELKAAMEMIKISTEKKSLIEGEASTKHSGNLNEVSPSFPGKEDLKISLQKLEQEIKETRRERDKAKQELARLKQHLLEKESEESEKMDEDSKVIEELRIINDHQRENILYLERALKQAVASHEEIKMTGSSEVQKYKELIDDLNKKLSNCMMTINAKNVELLNLQTALGQYYAEIEAKEHLEGDLSQAREEVYRLSQLLKDADQQADSSKKDKEEILSKLSQAERTVTDWKSRVNKVEEDNAKLRRALEQSMTRLNRMSVDSDFLVDRRIVIKLLVTYFQRNHSKEVLDLMVKMLGFSDEDKARIGGAQQGGGKGVVRGVLGLPGRFVGGILGGGSAQSPTNAQLDNQSFADLWVDFLLKENEERERREALDEQEKESRSKTPKNTDLGFSRTSLSPNPVPLRGNTSLSENSDTEFSTVPLTASDSNFHHSSRLFQKY